MLQVSLHYKVTRERFHQCRWWGGEGDTINLGGGCDDSGERLHFTQNVHEGRRW